MASRNGQSRRSSLLILLIASLLSLGAAELMARLLPKNYYEWQHRYMFLSEGVISNKKLKDGSNTQWYKPQQAINWAVFYGYPWKSPQLEYSIWLSTNNVGLVQTKDFNPNFNSIAVFGDSFTEPQATTPWFYALENHWSSLAPNSNLQLLNFGYQGTGIGRWDQITNNLRDTFKIKKAIYVAISQDFARLNQTGWSEGDLECFNTTKDCPGLYYQPIIGSQQDIKGLQTRAKAEIIRRHPKWPDQLRYSLCGSSELIRQISSLQGPPCYDGAPTGYQTALKKQMGTGFYFLKKHIELYGKPNTYLVWIPERNEAASQHQSPLTRKLLRFASNHLLEKNIIECPLGKDDFHPKDGHQNEQGSTKIYQCVSQALELIQTQDSQ